MKDRLDLENEIMQLHSFVDNIEGAVEYLAESNIDPKVIDNMSNILLGISTMLDFHAEKMFDTMCQCFKIDEYNVVKNCYKSWDKNCHTSIVTPVHASDMSYDPCS